MVESTRGAESARRCSLVGPRAASASDRSVRLAGCSKRVHLSSLRPRKCSDQDRLVVRATSIIWTVAGTRLSRALWLLAWCTVSLAQTDALPSSGAALAAHKKGTPYFGTTRGSVRPPMGFSSPSKRRWACRRSRCELCRSTRIASPGSRCFCQGYSKAPVTGSLEKISCLKKAPKPHVHLDLQNTATNRVTFVTGSVAPYIVKTMCYYRPYVVRRLERYEKCSAWPLALGPQPSAVTHGHL
jgi:hypothetical protein